jgi:large subunit ribosomal protein L5
LSRGVGAVSDKLIDYAVDELTKITGQKRYLQFQRKMLRHLKLRKDADCAKVTLRKECE